jgi:uncharacterized OsmC-like protein
MTGVSVTRLAGKQLRCRAGRHQLITDRKPQDGGSDAGCTSGELLLAAIGSCAAGSLRSYLETLGCAAADFALAVDFRPSAAAGARDSILIEVSLPAELPAPGPDAIKEAVLSGGVVSRLRLGSTVEVVLSPRPAQFEHEVQVHA